MLKNIKAYVEEEKIKIRKRVEDLGENVPSLLILQTGNDESSNCYARNKVKDCSELGISADIFKMNTTNEKDVLDKARTLVELYDGVIFLKPTNFKDIKEIVPINKDVDGFINENVMPSLTRGIIEYLDHCGAGVLVGQNVVILSRDEESARPLAKAFLNRHTAVSIITPYSPSEKATPLMQAADIIISATNNSNSVSPMMINENQIIIDAGICFDINGHICGDCSKEISKINENLTPVPGGVGLLTRVAALKNLLDLKEGNKNE